MKKFKSLIFILLLSFFSGCLNYEQVTVIKTDSSGDMFVHYWIKWNSPKDSLVLMNLEIFNADSMYSKFSSSFTIINDLQVYHNFNDSTLHAKVEFEFSNFDSLNTLAVFKEREFSIKDGPENTKLFSQSVSNYTAGWGANKSEPNVSYIYYLPGEIIKHNAHSLSNNKLTWYFNSQNLNKEKYLTATYRPFKLKETPLWIYLSALFVLFIVVVYMFSSKK